MRLFASAIVLAALPLSAVSAQTAAAPITATKPAKHFEIIDPAAVAPERMLPAPPVTGSRAEALELALLHQQIAAASPARLEQAKWDDVHEDPAIFNAVIGRDLKSLPATWALLNTVQNEADLAADLAKVHFARTRPWGVDASMPRCDTGSKSTRSYPSGHSMLGYSVGLTLAQLVPAKAPAILDRAHDYALSRQLCGAHFPSDTEASHALGMYVASLVLADPRMAPCIAAARAELAGL
jgi:acid phosphatase (class A)